MSLYLIPTEIESERLLLRTFQDEDWKSLYAYYSDPDCMKYTIGRTLTEGETWRTMASMIGHWQLRKFGPYALELKSTRELIGVCGMWYPNDWPEPEIKWGLIKKFQGKGYAHEAATSVKQMVKENLPNQSLISLINSENESSKKLALSLGCKLEKTIIFREQECHIYRHDLS